MEDAALAAVAPCWRAALREEGLSGQDPFRVAVWLEGRRGDVAPEHLELVARRASGRARVADLAVELGVRPSKVSALLRSTVLRLLVPRLEEVPRWRRAVDDGATFSLVAEASGVHPALVQVALEGWPQAHRYPLSQVLEASKAWAEGRPVAEIAEGLGVSRERLMGELRTGRLVLGAPRWSPGRVASRLGWKSDVFSRRRLQGVLPPADGRDRVQWWWPVTVERWITSAGLTWCTLCGRAFIDPKGLAVHITRLHPDLREC